MARVFVSHASSDGELAHEVYQWLRQDGHEVFLDQDLHDGIAVGEEWEQRLYERLRWADAVVCVLTSAYLASPWCTAEVGIARSQGSRLLPLLAEPDVVHPLLTSTQYTQLARDPVAARAALGTALRLIDAAGGWGWPDDRSPFPGLRPFDVDQHRVFFGRAAEIEALAGLLRSPAERAGGGVLLVVGPSGCGKSSLVRAGLFPVMTDEPGWWTLPPFTPAADPVAALHRELAAGARQVGLGWTLAQVRDRLHDHGLSELANELLLAAPGEGRRRHLLLVMDQFEELLAQAPPAARARFSELLRPGLDHPVQVVATLRPEFLAQVLASPELAGLPTRVFTLRPLHRDALATVIEEPARLAGIGIDEQLVDRLVADTDTGEALPLLAFTLEQLAAGVGRGGQLSATRYEQLGGVQGALVRQANAALADARAARGRSPAEVIGGLLRLVTVDEQGHPTRWRVDRAELPEPVRAELDAFVARRLLTTDARNGAAVIGVAHEAFLSAWPPLAEAITAAASGLRMRRAVEQAAAEWADGGRPPSRLWERGQLAAAVNDTGARMRPASRSGSPSPMGTTSPKPRLVGWPPRGNRVLVTEKVELSPRARSFLHHSIRRDRRRRRRATTVLSTLLVLAIAGAGVAINRQRAAELQQRTAQENERIAIARQLTTQAGVARDSDPRTALLLGVAAQHLHADPETRASLMHTLTTSHYAGTLTGHTGAVTSVAFAPDGRTLATGSADRTVLLWDLTDPAGPVRLGRPLTGDTYAVISVAFAPDGRTLATGGADKTVILWDLADRARPRQLDRLTGHTDAVISVAFAPDGRTLATGSDDKTVLLWNVADRARPARLGKPLTPHTEAVTSVAFAPDGRTLATGSDDTTVILWDVADRARPARLGKPLSPHNDAVRSVAFAPDGRFLAAGTDAADSSAVTLWDIADRARPRQADEPLTGHSSAVTSVALGPDGGTLATGSADKTVMLWDQTQPGEPITLTGHTDAVYSVAFSPDGRTLATGSADTTVILWEVTDRARPTPLGRPLTGHTGSIYAMAFAPDGRILAAGGTATTVTLWDLADPARPRQLGRLTGHTGGVYSMAFAPDGRTLAAGSTDKTLTLWDVTDPARPTRLGQRLTHAGWVTSVAFAPDGRTLATGSNAAENSGVILWDLTDRARPRQLGQPLTGSTTAVAFSPDRRTLATGGPNNTVIVWDVTDQVRPRQLGQPLAGPTDAVTSVAFSSDGRTLAARSSEDQTVIVWDVTDRARPTRLPLVSRTSSVSSVALAPDGRTLAIGRIEGTVTLWDLTDPAGPFQLGRPLTDHGGSVHSVAFAPNGRTLAAGGANTVILWDLTELNDLRAHEAQRACDLTDRGLNRDEWRRYISGLPYRDTCAG
jgi:WD40 repeat protein